MTTFRQVTGVEFDILTPRAEDIDIHALGHALSLANRYCGHTYAPYSVAEHALRVAALLPPELRAAGLHHDDHEGLGMGDIITQMKRAVISRSCHAETIRAITDAIDLTVCEKFALPAGILDHPEIKKADLLMLRAEQWYLRGWGPHLGEGSEELHAEMLERVRPFIPLYYGNARRYWLSMVAYYSPHLAVQPSWTPKVPEHTLVSNEPPAALWQALQEGAR